jgi:hypothetical protein
LELLFASSASALVVENIGFQPYSSATSVTCGVAGAGNSFGHNTKMDSSYSRMLLLGHKSMVNYSTTLGGATRSRVDFTCTTTGAVTAAMVKIYFNGVTTNWLTMSSGSFTLGQ